MNKLVKYLALALITLGLFSCSSRQSSEEETKDAAGPVLAAGVEKISLSSQQMEMAGIKIGMPERRLISSYVECTGQVEVPPQSLASVYTPVSGFVQTVRFLPGDYVKKGTILATIAHPELVRLQRTFLETKSRLLMLDQDYRRKETLLSADAASRRALEQAKAEFDMEQVSYRGQKAELEMIGLPVKQLEENGEIQPTLALRAPVSGYVNQVNVNIGKLVNPDELLYEIVDNSHVHLELQVFAQDVDKLRIKQRIEAWMPGKEKRYPAEVHLIGHMINPQTKTILVHGHFEKEPVTVTPGAFMHAHIYTQEVEVLAVPSAAVVREGTNAYVFAYNGSTFEKRAVSLGRAEGDYIELSDLKLGDGEKLVVQGAYYINGSLAGDE